MSEKKTPLEALIRELGAQERRELGPPPTAEELDAYADGLLGPEEAERVREHLTWNRESREVVLDLRSFPEIDPPPGEDPLSESELRAAWQKLEERLAPGDPPEPAEVRSAAKVLRWPRLVGAGRWPAALAAVLALVSVGLVLWNLSLSRQLEDLSAPVLIDDVIGLVPAETSVRGEQEPRAMPAGEEPLVWSLSLADTSPYRTYLVEITDPRGSVVWQGRGTRRTSAGTVAVLLPRRFLAAGDYRVLLHGLNDEKKLLGTYSVRVASR